jgi:signal transduction histidine kinase
MQRDPAMDFFHEVSRRKWLVLDALLAASVLGTTVARIPGTVHHGMFADGSWDALRYVAALLASLPLAVRRRWPAAVLVLVTTGNALLIVIGPEGPALLGVAFAIYSLSVSSPTRLPVRVGVVVGGVLLAAALVAPGNPEWAVAIAVPAVVLVGWFAGENTRAQRAQEQELRERAAERERQREERALQSAAQSAAEERLRIARELHDVVAHSMTLIAVRAGAGRVLLDAQPEEARNALSIIETTSRNALREMRRLVGVLRQPDEPGEADLEPAPRLAELEGILDQTAKAGVDVDVEISGEVRPLPEGVDVSAYRIVQEALTNVVRHAGPTTAHLRIRFRRQHVELELLDDGPSPAHHPPSPTDAVGHGLVGMRERVALYQGEFTAGPDGHGYRVLARLPIDDS